MARKKKSKRKPSKFNIAVGKFRKQGLTFKQSVKKAKSSLSSRSSGPKKRSRKRTKTLKRIKTIKLPMARKKKRGRRRKGSFSTGFKGIFSKENISLGVGSGLSGALGGILSRSVPQLNQFLSGVPMFGANSSEVGGALVVWAANKYFVKNRTVGLINKGQWIKIIGDIVEQNVAPTIADFGAFGQPAPPPPKDTGTSHGSHTSGLTGSALISPRQLFK